MAAARHPEPRVASLVGLAEAEAFDFSRFVNPATGDGVLVTASREGRPDVVVLLLEHRADANASASNGDCDTPLMAASRMGHLGVARLLLDRGADPNVARTLDDADELGGSTALSFASCDGHVGVVRLLLERGADPNGRSSYDGSTSLICASAYGHLAVAKLLLRNGADPNVMTTDCGSAALWWAVTAPGCVDVVQLLLINGANASAAKRDGDTALIAACHLGQAETVRLLLQHGADPNAKRAVEGGTALMRASANGHVQAVRLLLEHRADPNAAMHGDHYAQGTTALWDAALAGHVDVVQLLLEHRADPNAARTTSECTALIAASEEGHVEAARLLLVHNADPNRATSDDGCTGLILASSCGHMSVVQLLAAMGAAVAHVDNDGDTAQQAASIEGHDRLAGWLAAVADHAPIQIAVGCRMHGEARSALRTGALGDPTLCTLKDVMHAATGTGLWGADLELPPVCRATTRLARDAMACWSPERHWLFHGRVRSAVHTVLLVQERLNNTVGVDAPLPYLPGELWSCVCAMLLRRDWTVPPHAAPRASHPR